jgi:hypothetical protein
MSTHAHTESMTCTGINVVLRPLDADGRVVPGRMVRMTAPVSEAVAARLRRRGDSISPTAPDAAEIGETP